MMPLRLTIPIRVMNPTQWATERFATNGTIPIRIAYDHRVRDGSTIARALARMDDVLQTTIRAEMEALQSQRDGRATDASLAR